MRLTFKFLNNVKDFNTFDEVSELTIVEGTPQYLYIQLAQIFDEHMSPDEHKLRYIPVDVAATLSIEFNNIDSSKNLSRIATNPFSQDKSIWRINILASDIIQSDSITVKLTESGVTSTLLPDGSLNQMSTSPHGRFYS
jgi:hypothetical protein